MKSSIISNIDIKEQIEAISFNPLRAGKEKSLSNTLIHRIKRDIEQKMGIELKRGNIVSVGSTGTLLVDYGPIVVRMPQTKLSNDFCSINYYRLHSLIDKEFFVQIPKPIGNGNIAGQVYYAESKIPGEFDGHCKNSGGANLTHHQSGL